MGKAVPSCLHHTTIPIVYTSNCLSYFRNEYMRKACEQSEIGIDGGLPEAM